MVALHMHRAAPGCPGGVSPGWVLLCAEMLLLLECDYLSHTPPRSSLDQYGEPVVIITHW